MTKNKKLPNDITHLDLIKTFAVIVMIIDHIGLYLCPDIDWFRAVGRVGMPVWFFMIGYASSREIPNKLWGGALILFLVDAVCFGRIFALNALVTIIALRYIIDPVMSFITKSAYVFFLSFVLMTLGYFATDIVVEYGSLALIFAVLGFVTRHKALVIKETFMTQRIYLICVGAVLLIFTLLQNAKFNFDETQFAFMAVMSGIVICVLTMMRPMTFPQIKGSAVKSVIQFCGRKTLEIYVGHLLLLKVVLFALLSLN